jgi:hypothetical protein
MRSGSWAALVAVIALLLCAGIGANAVESPLAVSQQTPPPQTKPPETPTAGANSPGPEHFTGVWDYNAEQSVDAATGRKEQNPRTSQRRGASASGGGGPMTVPGAPYPGYGGAGGLGIVVVNEGRELQRDLLEVPEKLTIDVTPGAVTFTDDLDRAQAYPTDGKKYKFQLGAAVFRAKTYWDRHELKKEIEGAEAFKLFETYFLSEDGRRLFVVLRLGDREQQGRNRTPINGYNRVYDRVTTSR